MPAIHPCRENGTTLVAYSPLCQGLLTGKYNKDNRPTGPRAQLFTDGRYQSVQVGERERVEHKTYRRVQPWELGVGPVVLTYDAMV